MTKKQLVTLLRGIPDDAEIGYQDGDRGPECPADWITKIWKTENGSIAKDEQWKT